MMRPPPTVLPALHVIAAVALVASGSVGVTSFSSAPWSLAAAACVGTLLFFVLRAARARRAVASITLGLKSSQLLPVVAVLVALAAAEEIVWRGTVLGRLSMATGWPVALVVSAFAFAGIHLRSQDLRAAVHVATGLGFGASFLAFDSVTAAIVTHAAFNALVAAEHRGVRVSCLSPGRRRHSHARTCPKRDRCVPSRDVFAIMTDVWKRYGEVQALRGVSFVVPHGEVVAILGANGAGKTTTMQLLVGRRRADSGYVALGGRDPRSPVARASLGVMLQDIGFPPTLTVAELLHFACAHYPTPESVVSLARAFALDALEHRQVGGLSTGERRRLAVALAFAGRPNGVFLDEPSAGLDIESRMRIWAAIDAHAARGGSVLLSTHNMEEAERLASQVVVLANGMVVASGTVDKIRGLVTVKRVRFYARTLPQLPSMESHQAVDDAHLVYTSHPDTLIREMVASDVSFRELRVDDATLEEAFLALTQRRVVGRNPARVGAL